MQAKKACLLWRGGMAGQNGRRTPAAAIIQPMRDRKRPFWSGTPFAQPGSLSCIFGLVLPPVWKKTWPFVRPMGSDFLCHLGCDDCPPRTENRHSFPPAYLPFPAPLPSHCLPSLLPFKTFKSSLPVKHCETVDGGPWPSPGQGHGMREERGGGYQSTPLLHTCEKLSYYKAAHTHTPTPFCFPFCLACLGWRPFGTFLTHWEERRKGGRTYRKSHRHHTACHTPFPPLPAHLKREWGG